MLVSILHRVTGAALSIAGLAVLTWWLIAIADGPEAYAAFTKAAASPVGLAVLIALFPHAGDWYELLNSDAGIYGGSNQGNQGGVNAETLQMHGRPYSVNLTLPGLSALFFKAPPRS